MKFTKMHGAGNDFVVIDNIEGSLVLTQEVIAAICRPHLGIGADGLILVEASKKDAVRMNYYNQDGSIAEMCGNGVRCLAKYAVDAGIVSGKEPFSVETRAGRVTIKMVTSTKKRSVFQVEMGKVGFKAADIPVLTEAAELIGSQTEYEGKTLTFGCATMGNPHMAILVEDLEACPLETMGCYFESHAMFPENCNISFAQVVDRNHLRMDTYERGVGPTLACGTGTCATTAILNRMGLLNSRVEVTLSGGVLIIEVKEDGTIYMTGPAEVVFTGDYTL